MAVIRKTYTKPLPQSAEIFVKDGVRCARWIGRDGQKQEARVTKGRNGKDRVVRQASTLSVKVRDADGVVKTVSTGCRTVDAAKTVEAGLLRRRELVKAGVMTSAEAQAAEHATVPIKHHVGNYLAHLERIVSPHHLRNVTHQLDVLVTQCGFHVLRDLNASRVESWLLLRSREGLSARTSNTYLAAIKAFATWCVQDGRLPDNPFSRIAKSDEKADCRHQRRALSEEEINRLLMVAKLRPLAEFGRQTEPTEPKPGQRRRSNWRYKPLAYDDLSTACDSARVRLANHADRIEALERLGEERALIYRTLLLTGLRKGELASITVGQVDMGSDPPQFALHAADEKNRHGATIPLRKDLADDIRAHLSRRPKAVHFAGRVADTKSETLFCIPQDLHKVFNRDLETADIPKRDHRGRVVDVHALRTTFCSHLCNAGVSLRVAQAAMRHSDPRLTANIYTDPALLDVAGALSKLPDFNATLEKE